MRQPVRNQELGLLPFWEDLFAKTMLPRNTVFELKYVLIMRVLLWSVVRFAFEGERVVRSSQYSGPFERATL